MTLIDEEPTHDIFADVWDDENFQADEDDYECHWCGGDGYWSGDEFG